MTTVSIFNKKMSLRRSSVEGPRMKKQGEEEQLGEPAGKVKTFASHRSLAAARVWAAIMVASSNELRRKLLV